MPFARTMQCVDNDVRFPASHSAAAPTMHVSSWPSSTLRCATAGLTVSGPPRRRLRMTNPNGPYRGGVRVST